MKIHTTQAYLKQSRWLVFAMRVTFNKNNLSVIGALVEHNRKIFGAVQHSIIGKYLSIIRLSPSGSIADQIEDTPGVPSTSLEVIEHSPMVYPPPVGLFLGNVLQSERTPFPGNTNCPRPYCI